LVFTKNMQLPEVGFEPRSSHTAVRHVTARPLRPVREEQVRCLLMADQHMKDSFMP